MKIYKGRFKKKDGTEREMTFAKIQDIVQINEDFIASKIIGSGTDRSYKPGQELVWDLEVDDFRIFNWNKVLTIKESSVSDDMFSLRKVNDRS